MGSAWGRCGEDIKLRSERENYFLELGVLILKALLFRLDVREIVPDALDDAALIGDDAALLCYRLGKTSNEPAYFIRTIISCFTFRKTRPCCR